MKYRDNMSPEELAQFKAELNALDAAYAASAALDAQMPPGPDEWEDESDYWRRAGLDSRGRP